MPAPSAPIRLRFSIALNYEVDGTGTDFIFNIHAAHTPAQQILEENLDVSQPVQFTTYTDPGTHTRFLRLQANPGPLSIRYGAVLDITHVRAEPSSISELSVAGLPGNVLPYIYPSRYCQSDRLLRFANAQFGSMQPGYSRARAVCDWVATHVAFTSNSTSGTTSACDTLVEKQGVCRDFAHLMIALCRALNMPARFATGIDYGADPALGPQDFHAYVEVYMSGRWWLFDPSGTAIPMGFIRLATGRDAADSAFSTIFGAAWMPSMAIEIAPLPGPDGIYREPVHTYEALSTDAGMVG
ncbi:MAG: transglutaminase family protein [Ramlibacter sp.]